MKADSLDSPFLCWSMIQFFCSDSSLKSINIKYYLSTVSQSWSVEKMGNALAKEAVALITESKWKELVQLLADHAGTDDAGPALSKVVKELPEGRGQAFKKLKKVTPLGALILSLHETVIVPPEQAESLGVSKDLFVMVKSKKGKGKDGASPSRVRKLRVVCAAVEKLLSLPGFDATQQWTKYKSVIGHCAGRCFRCANALVRVTPPPLYIDQLYSDLSSREKLPAYFVKPVEVDPEYKSALPLISALEAKFGHKFPDVCNHYSSFEYAAGKGLDAPFWGQIYLHKNCAVHHMLFPECALIAEGARPEGAEGEKWKNPFIEKVNKSDAGRLQLMENAKAMCDASVWADRCAVVTRMALEDRQANTKEILLLAEAVSRERKDNAKVKGEQKKGKWEELMEDLAREPALRPKSRNKAISALVASSHVYAVYAFLRGAEAGILSTEDYLRAVLESEHTSVQSQHLLSAFVDWHLKKDWAALHAGKNAFKVKASLHPKGRSAVSGIEYAAVKGKVGLAKFLAKNEGIEDAVLRELLDSSQEYAACNAALEKKRQEAMRREANSYYSPAPKAGGGASFYEENRKKMEAEQLQRRIDHVKMMAHFTLY